jgi:hypothetical protein
MHDWADPHSVSWLDYNGINNCAVVYWTTVVLSGLIVLFLVLSLRRRPSTALLTAELLLGVALLLAACAPFINFFAPYWQVDERNMVTALLERSLTWREIGSYLACVSGLGLLCHLALSRSVCVRRALLWSTAPALFGAAAIYIGAH